MFYKAIVVGGVSIVANQDPEQLEIPQQLEMLGLDTLGFRFSAYLQSSSRFRYSSTSVFGQSRHTRWWRRKAASDPQGDVPTRYLE